MERPSQISYTVHVIHLLGQHGYDMMKCFERGQPWDRKTTELWPELVTQVRPVGGSRLDKQGTY